MKTPAEWVDYHLENYPSYSTPSFQFIEAIQRDAISDPMASTTDQQELDIARERGDWLSAECNRLRAEIERYQDKWHQARRYLRAANKGAERNSMVMRLHAESIFRLCDRIKQLESQLNNQ